MADFVECDICKAKPGTPRLCNGCVENRKTIADLETEVDNLKRHRDIPGEARIVELIATQSVLRDLSTSGCPVYLYCESFS